MRSTALDTSEASAEVLDVESTRVICPKRHSARILGYVGGSSAESSQGLDSQVDQSTSAQSSVEAVVVESASSIGSEVGQVSSLISWLRLYALTVGGALSLLVLGLLGFRWWTEIPMGEDYVVSPEIEPLVSRYSNLDDYFGESFEFSGAGNSLTLSEDDIAEDVSELGRGSVDADSARVSLASARSDVTTRSSVSGLQMAKRAMIRLLTQSVYDVVQRFPRKMDPVDLTSVVMSESLKAGFDPLLVAAVIKTESAFNPTAVSIVGARGLMQIMPGTKTYIENFEEIRPMDRKSLNDPRYNVRLGIAYLKYLIKMYNGNLGHALMAYNWGPGHLSRALKRPKPNVPSMVQRYAVKILDSHSVWHSRITTTLLFNDVT